MNIFNYVETIFCLYNVINLNSDKKQDGNLKAFAMLMYNYVTDLAMINKINLAQIKRPKEIQMAPLYNYVKTNNIQINQLDKYKVLDFTKKEILEAFILSKIFEIFKLHI